MSRFDSNVSARSGGAAPPPPSPRGYNGLLLGALSAFTYSLANVLIKLLTGMPVLQIAFFQLAIVGLLAYIAYEVSALATTNSSSSIEPAAYNSSSTRKKYENPFGMALLRRSGVKLTIRGLVAGISLLVRGLAVQLIPIGDAVAISSTSPIFVALMAWLYLRERVNWTIICCIVLTITGSFFIARPSFIFGSPLINYNEHQPVVGLIPQSPYYATNRVIRQNSLRNNNNFNNLSENDYNQLQTDAALDRRHAAAMATSLERPVNFLLDMLVAQSNDHNNNNATSVDEEEKAEEKSSSNSVAMAPSLQTEGERFRRAYRSTDDGDGDADFFEMPEKFNRKIYSTRSPANSSFISDRALGFLAALAASIIQAVAYVCVRAMHNEDPNIIIMYSGLAGAPICLLISLVVGWNWLPLLSGGGTIGGTHISLWLPLLTVGALSFGTNFLSTFALKTEDANVVSIARSSEVLWGYVWQILIFKDAPNFLSILGATLIFGSIVMLTLNRAEQQRRASAAAAATTAAAFQHRQRLSDNVPLLQPYQSGSGGVGGGGGGARSSPSLLLHSPPSYETAIEMTNTTAPSSSSSSYYNAPVTDVGETVNTNSWRNSNNIAAGNRAGGGIIQRTTNKVLRRVRDNYEPI